MRARLGKVFILLAFAFGAAAAAQAQEKGRLGKVGIYVGEDVGGVTSEVRVAKNVYLAVDYLVDSAAHHLYDPNADWILRFNYERSALYVGIKYDLEGLYVSLGRADGTLSVSGPGCDGPISPSNPYSFSYSGPYVGVGYSHTFDGGLLLGFDARGGKFSAGDSVDPNLCGGSAGAGGKLETLSGVSLGYAF